MVTRTANDPAKGLGWGAFLAGFVPGLLQYQLGDRSRAGVAFVSCTVLFFVGWVVVGERLFYWALVTPDGDGGLLSQLARFGIPTLPEMLNLPANAIGGLLAYDASPNGLRLSRAPRAFEHLGAWVTGASGMLATFWAADGHWQLRLRRDVRQVDGKPAPRPVASPGLCVGLSWLVPGLGHAKAGQKDKGIVMGCAVALVFALGLLFSGGHAVDRANYSVWWIGQNLFGGGSLFAALVTGPWRMESIPLDLDLGIVLCTVAGLMNLVVMCDAYTVAERSVFPVPDLGGPDPGAPDSGSDAVGPVASRPVASRPVARRPDEGGGDAGRAEVTA